jgi:hypothetical protein
VEIGTGWVDYFHQFLGAEMWCLDFQILLMSTACFVVGKPAMVQLIRSASWSGQGILELCKTILCETVGILARQGRQSSS